MTKISQHDPTTVHQRCHKDILGFEISVDDVLIVEMFEGDQDLPDYNCRFDV